MTAAPDEPSYKVGYKRPPAEHRFKKGASGNPKGRPRKQKRKWAPSDGLFGADERMKDWLLEEAYRAVTIREGDEVITLPAFQAMLRSMGVSAMKGDAAARKQFAEMLGAVAKDQRDQNAALLKTVMDYRRDAYAEIERCKREGLPPPEIIPHPDDVIIDPRSGSVRVEGPMDAAEKRHVDWILEHIEDRLKDIAWHRAQVAEGKMTEDDIASHVGRQRKHLDELNAALPDRYQRHYDESYDSDGEKLPPKLAELFRRGRLRMAGIF